MTGPSRGPSDSAPLLEYSADVDEPVSTVVAQALAAISDVPVTEMAPLYDVIDPDALDRLFDARGKEGSVIVPYQGYLVRIRADGTVTLYRDGEVASSCSP